MTGRTESDGSDNSGWMCVKRFAQIVEADVPCEDAAEIFGIEFLFQLKAEDGAGVGGVDLYAGEVRSEAAIFPDGVRGISAGGTNTGKPTGRKPGVTIAFRRK